MRKKLLTLGAVMAVALSGSSVTAQSLFSRFLDKFDVNNDGKISRKEVSSGYYQRFFDRMAKQYKLDPAKTYSRSELERVLAGSSSTGSTQSLTSSTSGSPSRRRAGPGRSGRPRRYSSSTTGQTRYRSLVSLPDRYASYDKDGDGQIGLYEWPRDRIAEFLRLDKNDDGLLTFKELGGRPRRNDADTAAEGDGQEQDRARGRQGDGARRPG